jgi:hypothetical protein
MSKSPIVIAAAVAAAALAGCGSSAVQEASNAGMPAHMNMQMQGHATASKGPRPTVTVLTPRAGAGVGSRFTVRVRLGHFKISPSMVGMSPVPGHGHLHFVLDGGRYDHPRYSGANGRMAVQLGVAGQYSPSMVPQITYAHIPRGHHTLIAELANNNHTSTGITATLHLVVR